MSAEDLYIRNIQNGIRAMKLSNTAPNDTAAPASLNRLKLVNEGLYQDWLKKYQTALQEYKQKNENKNQ